MGRNQFNKKNCQLTMTSSTAGDDLSKEEEENKFQALAVGLIETCSLEEPKNCTLKANLTVDDILKLPAFVRRNKNKTLTANAPTMPNLVSGESLEKH